MAVTTDITEMQKHTMDFHSALYTAESYASDCTTFTWSFSMDAESKVALESAIKLEELCTAVSQLCSGRSVCIDGFLSTFIRTSGTGLWMISMRCCKGNCTSLISMCLYFPNRISLSSKKKKKKMETSCTFDNRLQICI